MDNHQRFPFPQTAETCSHSFACLYPSQAPLPEVGAPETVAEHPTSHTGRYLKQVLAQHPPEVVAV
jgi:hypothetical protein